MAPSAEFIRWADIATLRPHPCPYIAVVAAIPDGCHRLGTGPRLAGPTAWCWDQRSTVVVMWGRRYGARLTRRGGALWYGASGNRAAVVWGLGCALECRVVPRVVDMPQGMAAIQNTIQSWARMCLP